MALCDTILLPYLVWPWCREHAHDFNPEEEHAIEMHRSYRWLERYRRLSSSLAL